MKEEANKLPTESPKPEFDPWEWAQGCDPASNPGELLKSCALQAHEVIKANQQDTEVQGLALKLMNMVAGIFQSDWKNPDGSYDEDAIRRAHVKMYMVGVESLRLAIVTKHDSMSVDEVIDEFRERILSAGGKKAARARHEDSNLKKTKLLAEWDATGNQYDSRADFSRIIGSIHGVKERTLLSWIAVHEKKKAQA